MATRVTLPPLDAVPGVGEAADSGLLNSDADRSPTADQVAAVAPMPGAAIRPTKVPVAKVQLLNDRGDREAESAWLRAAARPGVVELLSTSSAPFTIVTAHAGARTLRTGRLDPAAGLHMMLDVAELLTGLHHDGFVHGKLTVDHVIIGHEGPVLCSPDGTITDPNVDLDGVARCMRELGRQWDEVDARTPWRTQWDTLSQRLEDGTDPSLSAMRTAQALRRFPTKPAPSAPDPHRRPHRVPRGFAAAACAVVVAISGLALAPDDQPARATGPHILIDGSTYAIGQSGDDVAHLATPCDKDAPVVVLRPSTGEVWAFSSVGDGEAAVAMAVVPGATELRRERRANRKCDVAVARGPAGSTEIDTATLAIAAVSHAATRNLRPAGQNQPAGED